MNAKNKRTKYGHEFMKSSVVFLNSLEWLSA